MAVSDWMPAWRGQRCVIIASGPSAAQARLSDIPRGVRVLAINDSWKLYPSADALYACDKNWWIDKRGLPQFDGVKITQSAKAALRFGLRLIQVKDLDLILTREPGVTGSGGNGGFQALNLAIQFGAAKIVLVGYDMRVDLGLHWHGKHGGRLNNPHEDIVKRWRRALDEAAPSIAALGVDVINASAVSALTAYPKMSLKDALA